MKSKTANMFESGMTCKEQSKLEEVSYMYQRLIYGG